MGRGVYPYPTNGRCPNPPLRPSPPSLLSLNYPDNKKIGDVGIAALMEHAHFGLNVINVGSSKTTVL